MDSVTEELLNRFEILVGEKIAIQNDMNYHVTKEKALTIQIEELSRTVTILRKTLDCHNDFIDGNELREDFDKFKDKWTEEN